MGTEQYFAFGFGAVLLLILLLVSLKHPYPSDFQYTVMRIMLALASACVAVFLTGFLRVEIKQFIEAGGALAVFVIVYFRAPAALPTASSWVDIRSTWRNLRDINTNPTQVNQDDAVKAINAVNEIARIIEDRHALLEPFKKEYGEAFCRLYKKLRDAKILIHHEDKTSDLLLTQDAHKVAGEMGY